LDGSLLSDMQKDEQIEGIRSSVTEELLTWADGSLIDAELYSDYTQAEADEVARMTPEEVYVDGLRAGLPRDPRVEANLNMLEVKRLLGERSY